MIHEMFSDTIEFGYDYKPTCPWVYKERKDRSIASDTLVYLDDLRATGNTERECWTASQRVSSVLASLGIQDATRKQCPPSLDTGAWSSVFNTSNNWVTVLEKWVKFKAILV